MEFKVGQQVDLIIGVKTALGYTVLIDEAYEGLIYNNEIFRELAEGERTVGFIKHIREDGKIDVALQAQGFKRTIQTDVEKILDKLQASNGSFPLSDKSSPASIKFHLEMSKKAFKRAIGQLYKQKKIKIYSDRIELL